MNELMLEEIKAQPQYVANCLPELRKIINNLSLSGDRIIMGGCGDSYFSAIAVSSLFEKHNIQFLAATSQEIEQFINIRPTDLVILVSISGSTKRTVKAAVKANNAGARTVAMSCNPSGDLAKISNVTITFPYQPITRKTPHSLDFIINLLSNVLILENQLNTSFLEIDKISKNIDLIISKEVKLLSGFVNNVPVNPRFIFLGAGGTLGISMYGAAKFHEAGGITAFFCETENFWHGFNYMVQPHDYIVIFNNPNESIEVEQLLIDNLVQLTNNVLYVGTDKVESPSHVVIPSEGEIISPFIHSVVAQILCYATANKLNHKVDDINSISSISESHLETQLTWFSR